MGSLCSPQFLFLNFLIRLREFILKILWFVNCSDLMHIALAGGGRVGLEKCIASFSLLLTDGHLLVSIFTLPKEHVKCLIRLYLCILPSDLNLFLYLAW